MFVGACRENHECVVLTTEQLAVVSGWIEAAGAAEDPDTAPPQAVRCATASWWRCGGAARAGGNGPWRSPGRASTRDAGPWSGSGSSHRRTRTQRTTPSGSSSSSVPGVAGSKCGAQAPSRPPGDVLPLPSCWPSSRSGPKAAASSKVGPEALGCVQDGPQFGPRERVHVLVAVALEPPQTLQRV